MCDRDRVMLVTEELHRLVLREILQKYGQVDFGVQPVGSQHCAAALRWV